MADKYLSNSNGKLREVISTDASTGTAEAGKIVSLDNSGRLDPTLMPVGVGPDTTAVAATEAIAAGAIVNVFDDGGTIGVRNADGTSDGKDVTGFVMDAVASGDDAQIFFEGIVTGLSGLTPGVRYYLSNTAGTITSTPLTGAGEVSQFVGRSISATELQFEPGPAIVLA